MTLKRFFIVFILLLAIVTGCYFGFRNQLLDYVLDKTRDRIHKRFRAELIIGKSGFEGVARVRLHHIALASPLKDTLFYCNEAAASFSIWRFVKGQPPVNNIEAGPGYLKVEEYPNGNTNYSFLFRGKDQDTATANNNQQRSYRDFVASTWNRFLGLTDFNIRMTDFNLRWKAPGYSESVLFDRMELRETGFHLFATGSNGKNITKWNVAGTIDPSNDLIKMRGGSERDTLQEIPFFRKLSKARCLIRSFSFALTLEHKNRDSLQFYLDASAINPGMNHWRISPEDVMLDSMSARMNLVVKDQEAGTDPGSEITINQVPVKLASRYGKTDSTYLSINLEIDTIQAQTFFSSLPKGLFNELEGFKAKGFLHYHLVFAANFNEPESLHFDSKMGKKDFRILEYGKENLAMLNGSFVYYAREKGTVVRAIQTGPENPRFVPLEFISPLLVNAVLIAEDGTYFFHKGFNEEAFRQSIATNIREKRFARGGSTITMQLVKNVFLNRNKTISRKVEEALIVWLIENNYLVSKDRMLEVYLNIIEWGPGIYGISEAAEFYFGKYPSQLTLEESIYLSSIIPRPKTFRYTFDKEGRMKTYLKGYFDLVANRMLKKEIITQQQRDSLHFEIQLKGPALQLVVPADTIPVDSLLREEPDELF